MLQGTIEARLGLPMIDFTVVKLLPVAVWIRLSKTQLCTMKPLWGRQNSLPVVGTVLVNIMVQIPVPSFHRGLQLM